MAFVVIDVGVVRAGGEVLEKCLYFGPQGRLVGLDGEQIVGARLPDRRRDRGVGGDGVDGDKRPLQAAALRQPLDKHGNGGDFIALVIDRLLAKHQRAGGGESRNQMQGRRALRPVMAATRGLAVDVLPSMATSAGRSGQVWRTQAVKAAENSAGLIRFISKVSQRPPGTP